MSSRLQHQCKELTGQYDGAPLRLITRNESAEDLQTRLAHTGIIHQISEETSLTIAERFKKVFTLDDITFHAKENGLLRMLWKAEFGHAFRRLTEKESERVRRAMQFDTQEPPPPLFSVSENTSE